MNAISSRKKLTALLAVLMAVFVMVSMMCMAVWIAETLPRYPVRIRSNVIPFSFQCSTISGSALDRGTIAGLPKPPVWVDSSAVGSTQVSWPQADNTGNATVKEHWPTQEIS